MSEPLEPLEPLDAELSELIAEETRAHAHLVSPEHVKTAFENVTRRIALRAPAAKTLGKGARVAIGATATCAVVLVLLALVWWLQREGPAAPLPSERSPIAPPQSVPMASMMSTSVVAPATASVAASATAAPKASK